MARRGMQVPVRSSQKIVWAPVAMIALAVGLIAASSLWPSDAAPRPEAAQSPPSHHVRLGDGPAIVASLAWLDVETPEGIQRIALSTLGVGSTWDAGESVCLAGPECPLDGAVEAVRLLVGGADMSHRLA